MSKRKSNRVARRLLGMPYWRSNTKKNITWHSYISAQLHGVVFEPNEHLREMAIWMLKNGTSPQPIYFPHHRCIAVELILSGDM
ncbi:hypothetical protein CA052_01135 [Salmonella enterica]|nr:hypothetical protein [Salmonella enterica]EBR6994648.1 hypothetical protein [Salmonella enterica]